MALDTYTQLKAAVADYLARTDLTNQIPDFIRLAEKRIETQLNFVPNKNDLYTSSATMTAGQDYIYAPIGCIEPVHLRLETSPVRELDVVALRELFRIARTNTSGIPSAMAPVGNMRSGAISIIASGTGSVARCTSPNHTIVAGDWVYIYGTTNHNGRWQVMAVGGSGLNTYFEINDPYVANEAPAYWTTYQMRLLFDVAPSSALDYTLFYRAEMSRLGEINSIGESVEVTWLLSEWPNLILYGTLLEATPFIKDDPRIATWGLLFKEAMDDAKRQQWSRRLGGGELRVRADVPCP